MAAPVGNQNGKKAKIWEQALKRALARKSNSTVDAGLDHIADIVVANAWVGDKPSIDEIAIRMDGKAPQGITVSGDEDAPLRTVSRIELVDLVK